MLRLRLIPLFALVLALAAGSVGMATARHQPGAAGMVELCTTHGTATILVDARGNPVTPAHPCPQCTPALAALIDLAAPAAQPPSRQNALRWMSPALPAQPALALLPFRSRAPPVAV